MQQITVKDEGQDSPQPTTQLTVKDAAEHSTQTSQQIMVKDEGQDSQQPTMQLTVKDVVEDGRSRTWPKTASRHLSRSLSRTKAWMAHSQ